MGMVSVEHDAPATEVALPPGSSARSRVLKLATLMVAALALALFVYAFVEWRRSDDGRAGIQTYVIPEGSGARQRAGEVLDILPAVINLKVGEQLDIRNDDVEPHVIGPFFLQAGTTTTYRFTTPELISGVCSLHPSGNITIQVEA
jgi:hypothetical protein